MLFSTYWLDVAVDDMPLVECVNAIENLVG